MQTDAFRLLVASYLSSVFPFEVVQKHLERVSPSSIVNIEDLIDISNRLRSIKTISFPDRDYIIIRLNLPDWEVVSPSPHVYMDIDVVVVRPIFIPPTPLLSYFEPPSLVSFTSLSTIDRVPMSVRWLLDLYMNWISTRIEISDLIKKLVRILKGLGYKVPTPPVSLHVQSPILDLFGQPVYVATMPRSEVDRIRKKFIGDIEEIVKHVCQDVERSIIYIHRPPLLDRYIMLDIVKKSGNECKIVKITYYPSSREAVMERELTLFPTPAEAYRETHIEKNRFKIGMES